MRMITNPVHYIISINSFILLCVSDPAGATCKSGRSRVVQVQHYFQAAALSGLTDANTHAAAVNKNGHVLSFSADDLTPAIKYFTWREEANPPQH